MGLHFSADWFTGKIPLFQKHLARFVGQPGIAMLEVGTFEGRCACWLLQNILTHPLARLTCIDTFDWSASLECALVKAGHIIAPLPHGMTPERHFDENIRALGAERRVRKLNGPSRTMLPLLAPQEFSFIYIDGSHAATDVLTDAVLCWDLLMDDGILAFDDYGLEMYREASHNPASAIDAFLSVFGDWCDVLHKGFMVFLHKHARPPERPFVAAGAFRVVARDDSPSPVPCASSR